MDQPPLYQQIAESIRQEILYGHLRPGDSLPSMREMAERWDCTPGTVQRAYRQLSQQGLIASRPGRGTQVLSGLPAEEQAPLRRAALVHRAEAFLLEVMTAGYSPQEVEQAVRLALDHWRAMVQEPQQVPEHEVRFVGSHDPAISLIADHFPGVAPDHTLRVTFAGSLGGLIALAEGEADVAGSHLWDEESGAYNRPFVRRLLPGRRVALLTLAHRRLGLIVPPANPAGVKGLEDLARPGMRFVNRQRGAGTRVWLDSRLRQLEIAPRQISGYDQEVPTHSAVAVAVAEGRADVGLGVEAAALAYELDFVPLTTERYDLVIPADTWTTPPIQALADWLAGEQARTAIARLGGYETAETGTVSWIGDGG
jgi:molybdate-binding protein/DNA-binding transcriptional regulator YhcF (GntR family)